MSNVTLSDKHLSSDCKFTSSGSHFNIIFHNFWGIFCSQYIMTIAVSTGELLVNKLQSYNEITYNAMMIPV